jgi:hypothetical protein
MVYAQFHTASTWRPVTVATSLATLFHSDGAPALYDGLSYHKLDTSPSQVMNAVLLVRSGGGFDSSSNGMNLSEVSFFDMM